MCDEVPKVLDEGNTNSSSVKQISPAKRWAFTLNNWTKDEFSSIVPVFQATCSVAIIGSEVGDGGTPHLQGYCEFKSKRRPKSLMCDRIHWEKCKGNRDANVRYCSKEKNVVFSLGLPSPPNTISRKSFYPWQEKLTQIFEKKCNWDCRKIYWRFGDQNIGKTQFCKWLCVHMNAVVIGGSHKHILAQAQNSDSPIYIILLSYGDEKVAYKAIEQIKDGLYTSSFGCDNNKMTIRDASHILIIGNVPPDTEDRNFHPTKYNVSKIYPCPISKRLNDDIINYVSTLRRCEERPCQGARLPA